MVRFGYVEGSIDNWAGPDINQESTNYSLAALSSN